MLRRGRGSRARRSGSIPRHRDFGNDRHASGVGWPCLSLLFAAFHAIWAILVWAGAAQPLMDFIFHLHMIKPPYIIEPFNISTAAALVLVTGGVGFIAGWFFGFLWNRLVNRPARLIDLTNPATTHEGWHATRTPRGSS